MKYLSISAHTSYYPKPIEFRVGDSVLVGDTDDEFPGWVWVTTTDGNQGWAPKKYLIFDSDGQKAIANHNYSARELNTTKGEYLTLLFELAEWAWVENVNKESGWVPLNTIQRV